MAENMQRLSHTGSRKDKLKKILSNRDFNALITWARETRNPIRTLTSFQFDSDPLICMRAVEALGKVATLYKKNLEILRKTVQRFFWMMNDESGNVGWYAAETVGEILRNVPDLIPEYAHMLPAFLVEEPFEKGTRIAIARIAEIDKTPFNVPTCEKLIQTLDDPDPDIRGTSIIALKVLYIDEARKRVKTLIDDDTLILLYDFNTGNLNTLSISALAQEFN